VMTPIHFEGNSIMIGAQSYPRVKSMAACIRAAFRPIKVSGHSDRMGSTAYREEIGRNRAKVVKEELIKHGVIRELITTTSYGNSRMVCTGEHTRCAPVNRRVTIEFQ
jgi:outer membrane protein OmpA-like peptidoglycan-associated protein